MLLFCWYCCPVYTNFKTVIFPKYIQEKQISKITYAKNKLKQSIPQALNSAQSNR